MGFVSSLLTKLRHAALSTATWAPPLAPRHKRLQRLTTLGSAPPELWRFQEEGR